jgi:hypothetical protein
METGVFSQTGLVEIILPASVEVLGDGCFCWCRLLSCVIFESRSRLSRIGKEAFRETGLIEIILPASIEVLGERCFSLCKSLSSVTFESGSRLRKVGQDAFVGLPIRPTLPTNKCCLW